MSHPIPLKSQRFLHRCLALFAGLLLALALVSSGALGLRFTPAQHALLGLAAAVATVFSHTLAFFYLIETSINIKRAASQHGLSSEYADRHAPLKRQVFPLAFWSMIAVVVAAVSGGGLDSGALPRAVHWSAVAVALASTAVAWWIEDVALGRTRAIIHDLNAAIRARPPAHGPAPVGPTPVAATAMGGASANEQGDDPASVGPDEALWMVGRWVAFVAASLWILYGYRILVLHRPTPAWPFAAASVPLGLIALALVARFRHRPSDQRE